MREFNGRRSYIGLRLDHRLRLWAPTSASRAISAVAELLVILTDTAVCRHCLPAAQNAEDCLFCKDYVCVCVCDNSVFRILARGPRVQHRRCVGTEGWVRAPV